MKFILCILFLFSSKLKANGADFYTFDRKISHKALDIYEITLKLKNFGLFEMDLKRQGQFLNSDVDQIYFSPTDKNIFVILKLNLKFNKKSYIKLSNDKFVCHAKTNQDRDFSLYFEGFSESTFQSMCNKFKNTSYFSRNFILYKTFLNFAFANESTRCHGNSRSNVKSISNISENIDTTEVVQQMGVCLSEFVGGVKSTFNGFSDELSKLLENPTDLWQNLSEQAKAIHNFILHLSTEAIQLKRAIGSLDNRLVIQLACRMGGEVLVSAGISAVTGFGLSKLALTFVSAINKLKSMSSIFTQLNRLNKIGQAHLAKEILSCGI